MKRIALILFLCSTALAISPTLNSFNVGQVSPYLEARGDFAQYGSTCRIMENMFPLTQGPVMRRPGTKYIATSKAGGTDSYPVRLIPFEYSTLDTYVLEGGEEYFRFYRDGSKVVDNDSSVVELTTIYDSSEIWDVSFTQTDNIMYLCDGNNIPQVLTRADHNDWTIVDANLFTGPFLPVNTDASISIQPPDVTEDITTTGFAIASSEVGGSPADDAFDNNFTSGNQWKATGNENEWIGQDFGAANDKAIVRMKIWPFGESGQSDMDIKHFKIEASDDGSLWTKISVNKWFGRCEGYNGDEVYGDLIKTLPEYFELFLDNAVEYRYWRVFAYDNWGDAVSVQVLEIEMFEADSGIYTTTGDIFKTGHIGSIWQLNQEREVSVIKGALNADEFSETSVFFTGPYSFTTDGTGFDMTVTLQRSTDFGGTWQAALTSLNSLNFDNPSEIEEVGAIYRVKATDYVTGTITYTLTISDTTNKAIIQITDVNDDGTESLAGDLADKIYEQWKMNDDDPTAEIEATYDGDNTDSDGATNSRALDGVTDNAVGFKNGSAVITGLPGHLFGATNSFTIAAWIKFNTALGATGIGDICSKYDGVNESPFRFYYDATTEDLFIGYEENTTGTDNFYWTNGNFAPVVDTWYHVVGMVTPGTASAAAIYIDKSKVNGAWVAGGGDGEDNASQDDLTIKIGYTNVANRFLVDNLCLFSDLLTYDDVSDLYDMTNPSATATALTPLSSDDSTTKWREGYWSDYRGWPKTVAVHQQRLVFGGSDNYAQTLWFGKANPDDYLDFTEGTLDDSAFTVALPGQNPISWLRSQDYLIVGTSGSVGKYGDQGEAITPTSPNYREQTQTGAAPLMSVMANDTMLYVERGGRRVREFSFSLARDKYVSPDLNVLSPEITESGIKDIAFQTSPEPVMWCVLNDGNMATLVYRRDLLSQSSPIEVVAWSKQITDGDFESVCRIPGDDEDEIWVSVKRTIDSNDYRFLEQFQPRDWGEDSEDCWFVDSGLDYDSDSVAISDAVVHMGHGKVTITVSSWPSDSEGDDLADDDNVGIRSITGYSYLNDTVFTVADAVKGSLTFQLKNEDGSAYIDGRDFIVAQWKMNDDEASYMILDASIGEYDSVFNDPSGNPWTNQHTVEGHINTALDFDGVDDYIATGQSYESIFQNSFSFSFWLKPDDGHPDGEMQIMFGNKDGTRTNGCNIQLKDLSGQIQFAYESNGNTVLVLSKGSVFHDGPADDWVHVAVTADSTGANGISLYIDGELSKNTDTTGVVFGDYSNTVYWDIGARKSGYTGHTHFFDGKLDNIQLFSKELSAAEVGALYNSGAGTETEYSQYDRYASGGTVQMSESDFSGIDHLIGESVYIWGDGVIMPDETVNGSGEITIDRAAARVIVGLPFTSKLETMPLRIDPQDMAANKKIKVLDFDFFETGYCQYGNGRNSTLININFENDMNVDPNAVAQPLYTSDYNFKHVTFPFGSMKKQTIYIESDKPAPLTLRAIGTNYDFFPY